MVSIKWILIWLIGYNGDSLQWQKYILAIFWCKDHRLNLYLGIFTNHIFFLFFNNLKMNNLLFFINELKNGSDERPFHT